VSKSPALLSQDSPDNPQSCSAFLFLHGYLRALRPHLKQKPTDLCRDVDLVATPIDWDGLQGKLSARARHTKRGDTHLQSLGHFLCRHRHAIASGELGLDVLFRDSVRAAVCHGYVASAWCELMNDNLPQHASQALHKPNHNNSRRLELEKDYQ
jgi:hypothetical protein